jgi:hypothetical protein
LSLPQGTRGVPLRFFTDDELKSPPSFKDEGSAHSKEVQALKEPKATDSAIYPSKSSLTTRDFVLSTDDISVIGRFAGRLSLKCEMAGLEFLRLSSVVHRLGIVLDALDSILDRDRLPYAMKIIQVINDCDHTLKRLDVALCKVDGLVSRKSTADVVLDERRVKGGDEDELESVRVNLVNHTTAIIQILHMIKLAKSMKPRTNTDPSGEKLNENFNAAESIMAKPPRKEIADLASRVRFEERYMTEPIAKDSPPQPIVIREAPVEKYEVVLREQFVDNREVAPPRRQEEDYYYRRDVQEVEPRRDEVALTRYDRREVRPRHSVSDDDESVVYERKERRVVRDRSHSPRHKLHLAEGALAGAGAAALIANHREKSEGVSEHRRRKVAAAAAAGALGAELITRAHSHYRDRSRDHSRSRSRSSSRGHGNSRKLKTGPALAATAHAAAAAAGIDIANRNERKEEAGRERIRAGNVSRRGRYSADDDYLLEGLGNYHS